MKSKIKGMGLNETTQWDVIKSVYLHTFYIYRYLCVDKYKTRYTVMIKGRLFSTIGYYFLFVGFYEFYFTYAFRYNQL